MPLFVHDLTDLLLGATAKDKFWFLKRKHQGRWYYLKEYDENRNAVTWTRNKEHAATFPQEKAATQIIDKLNEHCQTLITSRETLE